MLCFIMSTHRWQSPISQFEKLKFGKYLAKILVVFLILCKMLPLIPWFSNHLIVQNKCFKYQYYYTLVTSFDWLTFASGGFREKCKHIQTHTYIYVYLYICLYVCVYACIIYIHTCSYIYTHVHTLISFKN